MKRFQIRHLILVACLVSTAYAEHRLGTWIGWGSWISWVIPGVADLYLIHATQKRKDMVAAVLVVVVLCALSYSVTMPLDPVKTPISIGVSSLAPLVLWRLHVTHDHKMEMLWGQETAKAVHEQRDNGWTYEFIPADFPRSLPGGQDVSEPQHEVTADPVEDGPESAVVNMTDEQREQTIYSYFTLDMPASKAAEAAGVSPATAYRRYRAYKDSKKPVPA